MSWTATCGEVLVGGREAPPASTGTATPGGRTAFSSLCCGLAAMCRTRKNSGSSSSRHGCGTCTDELSGLPTFVGHKVESYIIPEGA